MRAIAFYLPQFHPIPENDAWWGEGFTEWTNADKARPLFPGHDQPHVPGELGRYDLRDPAARAAQADLARAHGVEAFCWYHYWFAGKRLLERPFGEVLASGEPDFPFCLCWANQTWTGIWHGAPDRVLIAQTYPGDDDHRAHFDALLPAFADRRHLRVEGKPLFMVYQPSEIPEVERVTDLWRDLASRAGLGGLHLVGWRHGRDPWDPRAHGFDAVSAASLPPVTWRWRSPLKRLRREIGRLRGRPAVHDHARVMREMLVLEPGDPTRYPCVIPNWDNTPRSGRNGLVLTGSTPALFREQLRLALDSIRASPPERRILFVKSWNEWAEGNHLEPDRRFGRGYLEALRDEVAL